MFESSNLLFDHRSGWHFVERARCCGGERDFISLPGDLFLNNFSDHPNTYLARYLA
jgi:hypothetical protein